MEMLSKDQKKKTYSHITKLYLGHTQPIWKVKWNDSHFRGKELQKEEQHPNLSPLQGLEPTHGINRLLSSSTYVLAM